MQTEMRFHWDRLESYMLAAIDKSTNDGSPVSDTIKGAIPDMIAALRGVIVSTDASPTQRMRACEILFSSWSRCLRADLRESMAELSKTKWLTKRQQALAEKSRAQADAKQSQITIARERRKIARALKRAEAQQEKGEQQNEQNQKSA